MRTADRQRLRGTVAAIAAAAAVAAALTAQPDAAGPPGADLAVRRGLAVLEDPSLVAGSLEVEALLAGAEDPGSLDRARLEVAVGVGGANLPDPATLRVWLVASRADDVPAVRLEVAADQSLAGAAVWSFGAEVELPLDFLDAAVVVEELSTGAWGAAVAAFAEAPPPAPTAVVRYEAAPLPAPTPPATASGERAGAPAKILRLLPPRAVPATGSRRFHVFTSDERVAAVEFYLDGTPAGRDESAPFSAVIDLGKEARPVAVRAVALDSRGGELGGDEVTLNAADTDFRVRIVRLTGPGTAGRIEIEGEVDLPPGADLAAVELFLNERRVASFTAPPYRAAFDAPGAGPSDFVRLAARLADGTSLDDARLLGDGPVTERLEVNLVEIYAVVVDREGRPVTDLDAGDFTVRLAGTEVELDRFGQAEEVPLHLGLVVDTSGSMETIMVETKRAGARFLAETLRPGDAAFLVDFDAKPRLAHATTEDLRSLLDAFGGLRPDGLTAIYDAVIFSFLQFDANRGRRALVVLSDGDDVKSRLGRRQAIQYGRRLGVPVYVIGLAGIQDPRRSLPRPELDGLASATGGGTIYLESIDGLGSAYARIQAELRSQYLLAFSTDRALSDEEIDRLEVRVEGRGREVRAVVGGRQLD